MTSTVNSSDKAIAAGSRVGIIGVRLVSGRFRELALPEVDEQQRYGRWGHAFKARRLAECYRTDRFESLPRLVRQPVDIAVIDVLRQPQLFLLRVLGDLTFLAVDVARVLGFDFDLQLNLFAQLVASSPSVVPGPVSSGLQAAVASNRPASSVAMGRRRRSTAMAERSSS